MNRPLTHETVSSQATSFRIAARHDIVVLMKDEDLIALALGLPETAESSHFGIRDFRVRSKIFMTLPGPDFCGRGIPTAGGDRLSAYNRPGVGV